VFELITVVFIITHSSASLCITCYTKHAKSGLSWRMPNSRNIFILDRVRQFFIVTASILFYNI